MTDNQEATEGGHSKGLAEHLVGEKERIFVQALKTILIFKILLVRVFFFL